MATAFAQQLRQIAVKSTNELDLRSRREAHAESLIFERNVAVKQDWETLYHICVEGFQELCLLDSRFKDFQRNLFAPSSKDQDREQLNKSQNESLDLVIEQCLELLGSRLTLRPGIKALEWMVRRFRIHIYNSAALLLTVLPQHEEPLFQNVLSIIPVANLVDEWKFLRPYHQSPSLLPRHTIIYTATTSDGLFSALNQYALDCCQNGSANPVFLRFWTAVIVEAVGARLKQAKSGRREIQNQRVEDTLHKILPVISDGLALKTCPDMMLACFAIASVLACSQLLGDETVKSLIVAIAQTIAYPSMDTNYALACLLILITQTEEPTMPGNVVDVFASLPDPVSRLKDLKQQYPISSLMQGLVRGILSSMTQKNMTSRLDFLGQILKAGSSLSDDSELSQLLFIVVSHYQELNERNQFANSLALRLRSMLQDLQSSPEFASVFAQLLALSRQQSFDLEALLEATIPELEDSQQLLEDMELDEPTESEPNLDALIAALPRSIPEREAFLVSGPSPTFQKLFEIFKLCVQDGDGAAKFAALDVWRLGGSMKAGALYVSFLIRVACGPYESSIRAFAIPLVALYLNQKADCNSQVLLLYVTVLLADQSTAVRRQAAYLILALEKTANTHDVKGNLVLFDASAANWKDICHFEPSQLAKILKQVFLPYLEECVSDGFQIRSLLQQAITGSSSQQPSPSKQVNVELKKSMRHSLFDFLIIHALATPLLKVKLSIIELLDGVGKVGTTTRNEALNPVLHDWIALSLEQATKRASEEDIPVATIDGILARLVSARDRQAFASLINTIETTKLDPRPEIITALFENIAATWGTLKTENQPAFAHTLFSVSFSEISALARGARATLKKVSLSTVTLQAILQDSIASAEATRDDPSPKKKRKLSHGENDNASTRATSTHPEGITRLVLALELIEGSIPETKPELMSALFDALILIRRLKASLQSESPYALGLCLNCLLVMIDQMKKSRNHKLDLSSIRADVVIECVRNAESPQVQSDALLLSASLAELAPDRVIHHIMPVFTFMGTSMMSLDDGHSVNVINQAIDRIIPPLVGKLKQEDQHNLIRATTGLLSSFVTAFDHIPQHRRVKLYQRLLKRLGPEDFGFALSAMLATTKASSEARHEFLVNVMSEFTPLEQLVSYSKIISLVGDIYSDKPHDADSLLHIDSSSSPTDRLDKSQALFSLAERLLKSKALHSQLSKHYRSEEKPVEDVQKQLNHSLRQILETLRSLKPYGPDMTSAARKCMTALLELLSLSQLISLLPGVLEEIQEEDADLKPEVLFVLASQMGGKVPSDRETAQAALAYLSELENILQASDSDRMKAAAIACIDKITEKYGRKDIDATIKAAAVLSSDAGMAADSSSTRHLSVLTLCSIFDIVGEAAVPLVSETMKNAFDLIESSFEEAKEDAQLHDAAFTLVSTVVSNVPFMITEDDLDRILTLAAEAAFSDLPISCNDSRRDSLSTVARKMDISMLIASLSRSWTAIVENDIDAVLATADMCIQAVEFHSKTAVVKAADSIASFITQILDLRRVQLSTRDEESYSEEEVSQVETKATDLSQKFIYKLNDTAFRPVFETWVDWAVKCHDLPANDLLPRAKLLRQTSLFILFTHFFNTLKSLVTNYSAYIIAPANIILQDFADGAKQRDTLTELSTSDTMTLYTTLLTLLTSTMTYDNDSFYTPPSHFQPLSTNILSQLSLAFSKPFRPIISNNVIPTIVALATAVQDTPAHHLLINHHLSQLRHSDSPAVRIMSIRTHLAITASEEVGEEWVNNVVISGVATGESAAGVGGSGETMIYVNEMLEDDDEEVEREVRRWVGIVREMTGEDVFEF